MKIALENRLYLFANCILKLDFQIVALCAPIRGAGGVKKILAVFILPVLVVLFAGRVC